MKFYLTILLLSTFTLIGCSSSDNQSLYYWGDYQENIYKTLNATNSDPKEQIITLEKIVTVASSKNSAVPPGLYANLGLLYIQDGRISEAKAYFDKERALYPESATYMLFLTDNIDRKRR